jgi:hypothetical protein
LLIFSQKSAKYISPILIKKVSNITSTQDPQQQIPFYPTFPFYSQNSYNPFNLANNPDAEGKLKSLKDKQTAKNTMGRTKSKVVMIDLNSFNNEDDKIKSSNQKEKETSKESSNLVDEYLFNNIKKSTNYLSPDNQNRDVNNYNTIKNSNNDNNKINSINIKNKNNTLQKEKNLMKLDSKNSLNLANKDLANGKSKVLSNASSTQNKDHNQIKNQLLHLNNQDTNTLNYEDYAVNPEQKIYKSKNRYCSFFPHLYCYII